MFNIGQGFPINRYFFSVTETEADIRKESVCLGLLTGKIDRTRLADHGPDVQRPKSTVCTFINLLHAFCLRTI